MCLAVTPHPRSLPPSSSSQLFGDVPEGYLASLCRRRAGLSGRPKNVMRYFEGNFESIPPIHFIIIMYPIPYKSK